MPKAIMSANEVEGRIDSYLSSLGGIPEGGREAILHKIREMPPVRRRTYLLAVTGRSRRMAVRSFCLECMGWSKREAQACNTISCPLWPYRPYRPAKGRRAAAPSMVTMAPKSEG